MPITFAEVAEMKARLLARASAYAGSDEELLRRTEDLLGPAEARSLRAQLAAQVSTYLQRDATPEVRALARGALASVIPSVAEGEHPDPFRLRHVFVLRFALRELRKLTGKGASPFDFDLDDEAKHLAISMFESLIDARVPPDRDLVATAELYSEAFRGLGRSPLFARFLSDLVFLQQALLDSQVTAGNKGIARAALAYLLEEKDAIPDDLGLVGILDDAFVARTAAERIDPGRKATTEILERALSEWPVLLELCLEAAGGYWMPSEFAIVNFASTVGDPEALRSAIIVPDVGPLPFLVGLLSTLSLLSEKSDEATEFLPKPGDFIRPAGEEHGREFVGYFTAAGPQYETDDPSEAALFAVVAKRGTKKRKPLLRYQPLGNLRLWERAKETRAHREVSLVPGEHNVVAGPLERLFHRTEPSRLGKVKERVVLVSTFSGAREHLQEFTLMGHPLSEIVPAGAAKWRDDEFRFEPWMPRVSSDGAPLTIVRTPSEAAEFAERNLERIERVVLSVDRPEQHSAALQRLKNAGVPTTVVVPTHALAVQRELELLDFRFLDWTQELAGHLAWGHPGTKATSLTRWEAKNQSRLAARLHLDALADAQVDAAFESLIRMRKSARGSDPEDLPRELADFVVACSEAFFDLSSSLSALDEDEQLAASLEARFTLMRDARATGKRFWERHEQERAEAVEEALRELARHRKRANPKGQFVRDLLDDNPDAVVVCHARRLKRYLDILHLPSARLTTPAALLRGHRPDVSIVVEWLGREKSARLLLPPISPDTHVVAFPWEDERYSQVVRESRTAQGRHWRKSSRSGGWTRAVTEEVPGRTDPDPTPSSSAEGGELDDWLSSARRRLALAYVGEAESGPVEVVLFHLVGGGFGLFEPRRRMKCVTHLLGTQPSTDNELDEKMARDLRAGDVVLVYRGADRDFLREMVDEQMPAGTRDLARLWHGALTRFEKEHGRAELLARLRSHGCRRHPETMRGWIRSETIIGPRDVDDIDHILAATGDERLRERVDDCKTAVRAVRAKHVSMSQELAERVLQRLKDELDHGGELIESVHINEQLRLVTIESVDKERQFVSQAKANHIYEVP